MKRVYLFLLFITICTLTSCGLRVEANEEMVRFFDDEDGKWNTALSYTDEELTPQYIINVYQEKTPTVIQTEDTDAYEKVLIYTTYENSDIVKVVVDDNAIHGVTYDIVSKDFLTFYYKGTEKFFSTLNEAISDEM